MRWLLCGILILGTVPLLAQTAPVTGYCNKGGNPALVSGIKSTNYPQIVIPSCKVTVYLHGTTTLATIYADSNNTPLANPFTANTISSPNPGAWIFWAATGQGYDVVGSGGVPPNTYTQPITLTEVYLSLQAGASTPNGSLGEPQVYGTGPAFLGSPAYLDASAFSGADPCAAITNAEAGLPAGAYLIDARGLNPALLAVACASPLTVATNVKVLLPIGSLILGASSGIVLNTGAALYGSGVCGQTTTECPGTIDATAVTGTAIDFNNCQGCRISNFHLLLGSTTATGIKVWGNYVPKYIDHLSIWGGGTGTKVVDFTGNTSAQTVSGGSWFSDSRIDQFAGIGLDCEHTIGGHFTDIDIYHVPNNLTSIGVYYDTGCSGAIFTNVTSGGGGKGLVIDHSQLGVGPSPYSLYPDYGMFQDFIADTNTGGDAISMTTNLATFPVNMTFSSTWAGGAGKSNSQVVTTPHAAGVHCSGGSGWTFTGTQDIRQNSGPGYNIDGTCINVNVTGGAVDSNNFENDQSTTGPDAYESNINIRNGNPGIHFSDLMAGNTLDANGHAMFAIAWVGSGSFGGDWAHHLDATGATCSSPTPPGFCPVNTSFLFQGTGQVAEIQDVNNRALNATGNSDFPVGASFGNNSYFVGLDSNGDAEISSGLANFFATYQLTPSGGTQGQWCFNVPMSMTSQCAVKVEPNGVFGANLGEQIIGGSLITGGLAADTIQESTQAGHAGCGQFDASGNLTSTGSACGSGGGAGVTSIQMQNNGTNYGAPMTGVGTLNFANCTVTGTSPSFTITCAGGGTVTSIATAGPITGGPITATGTIGFAGTDVASSGNVVATHLFAPLPIAQGGNGSASPSIVAGTNITVTGVWPNQTINSTGGGSGIDVNGGPVSGTPNFGNLPAADTNYALNVWKNVGGSAVSSETEGVFLQNGSTPFATMLPGNTLSVYGGAFSGSAGNYSLTVSGGGGGSPGGGNNDVQINESSTFVADAGEFQENPSTHTMTIGPVTAANTGLTPTAFTCFQSDGITPCIPQWIGGLGSQSLPSTGQTGWAEQLDYFLHTGLQGVDNGPGVKWLQTVGGSPNALTMTAGWLGLSPTINDKFTIQFTPISNNASGSVSITIDGIPYGLVGYNGVAATPNMLVANSPFTAVYNANTGNFQNASGGGVTGTGSNQFVAVWNGSGSIQAGHAQDTGSVFLLGEGFTMGNATYATITGGTLGNGTVIYCSNCDAPTVSGTYNTCTSSSGMAGAEAHKIRGTWQCF